MDSTDTSSESYDADPDSNADKTPQLTYTRLEPSCPVCENSKFESTEEGVPNGFDTHYVHVCCANCKTHLTIEYRAIDVFWTSGFGGQYSAISQDLLDPTEQEYVDEVEYGALPGRDLLGSLNWPLTCDCGERLTGNDLVSDPTVLPDHDVSYDDPDCETVLLRCVNCEDITSETPPELE